MSYVTVEYYKNTYHGNSIPDEQLQGFLERASMNVDTLTRMKIKQLGGFSQLSEFEQLRVQLAVCSQADYLYNKAAMQGVSSYSIGDVSVSFDNLAEYDLGCVAYLRATNLLYRGL